jgi:CDP-glycerol glycerophosphotransferase
VRRVGRRGVLSVVLVVHREQGFIEECIRSFSSQSFADAELVVVDDASPDHAPAILDELAERDERVTVHHLPARVGFGEARNLALEHVRGEHVWFVETTDLLVPGSLATVDAALRATSADVLLLHHSRDDVLGRRSAGPHAARLRKIAAAGPAPLDRHPRAAAVAPEPWDKVLRRTLLADGDARFGTGAHGELPVTWPALLRAERIAALPEPVYVRRRPANAVRHGAAVDVFAQFDAALRAAGADGTASSLALPAMVQHALALLDRQRGAKRREFLARMGAWLREHPREDAALRVRLIERGARRALAVVDRARAARARAGRARRRLGRLRRRVKGALRRRRLDRYYRGRLRRPIDGDLAVFYAYWGRGYSCNPRAIYEKARELVPGFRGVWVVRREAVDALPAGVEHVVAGTREYYDVLARARYFVSNVNFPDRVVKREGTVHVMTHHGTPLKRMGIDLRDTPIAGRRMDFDALLRRSSRWDFSISSNPLSTVVWERVFPLPYETLEVGYPRNDALVNATDEDVRRVREELGIRPDQTAVLYAPTHREYREGYVPTMDVGEVAATLGPGHVLLARAHYFYGGDRRLAELHRAGRLLDVSSHPSIEELCLAADVLVTDYSSLMFDYAVLDRPIVIHAPDWEVYRAMRGTTFDFMEQRPGVVARTDDEVVEALLSGAAAGDEARRDRAAFRARFCALEDGRAAERVVRRVWLGEREPARTRAAAVAS